MSEWSVGALECLVGYFTSEWREGRRQSPRGTKRRNLPNAKGVNLRHKRYLNLTLKLEPA